MQTHELLKELFHLHKGGGCILQDLDSLHPQYCGARPNQEILNLFRRLHQAFASNHASVAECWCCLLLLLLLLLLLAAAADAAADAASLDHLHALVGDRCDLHDLLPGFLDLVREPSRCIE